MEKKKGRTKIENENFDFPSVLGTKEKMKKRICSLTTRPLEKKKKRGGERRISA